MYLFFAWLAVSLTLTAVELKWGVWKVAALVAGLLKKGVIGFFKNLVANWPGAMLALGDFFLGFAATIFILAHLTDGALIGAYSLPKDVLIPVAGKMALVAIVLKGVFGSKS